jgi:hypothetical protein
LQHDRFTTPHLTPTTSTPTTMRVLSVVALAAFALVSSNASLDHNARKAEREAKHAVNEGAAAADGVFASASRAAGDAANVSCVLSLQFAAMLHPNLLR